MAEELSITLNSTSYTDLLQDAGISISSMDVVHLSVGKFPSQVDWVIHIGVALTDMRTMLFRMFPLIRAMQLYITMPKDEATASRIIHGELGENYLGKMITCYAADGPSATAVYQKLVPLTEGIQGTTVLTAMPLSGILYTQYVGTVPFQKDMWPFPMLIPVYTHKKIMLKDRYRILRPVSDHVRGYVFVGVYIKGFLRWERCIIKEGREDLRADEAKRSMADRLEWQRKVLLELQNIVPVPKVLDICKHEESTYLIMQLIKGNRFGDFIHTWYQDKTWPQLSRDKRQQIFQWLISIANEIQQLHMRGYVHRDITPNNFILDKTGKIHLIDFEMSYSLKDRYPMPAFSGGTFGFMPPEQARNEVPTLKEDSWAFGGMMIVFLTGKPPHVYRYHDPTTLAEDLAALIDTSALLHLIKTCYHHNPLERPSIQQIIEVLQNLIIK